MCYARRQRSSWARIKLSKNFYLIWQLSLSVKIFFRAILILSFFYLLSIYNSLTRFALRFFALYFSLVVQFSMTVCCLSRTAWLLYHILFRLSSTFLNFFQLFFKFFSVPLALNLGFPSKNVILPQDSLPILPLLSPFVKTFWKKIRQRLIFIKKHHYSLYSEKILGCYASENFLLVGHRGREPRTDRLWAGCSNQLS